MWQENGNLNDIISEHPPVINNKAASAWPQSMSGRAWLAPGPLSRDGTRPPAVNNTFYCSFSASFSLPVNDPRHPALVFILMGSPLQSPPPPPPCHTETSNPPCVANKSWSQCAGTRWRNFEYWVESKQFSSFCCNIYFSKFNIKFTYFCLNFLGKTWA